MSKTHAKVFGCSLGKPWKTVMHTYRFATCLLRFLQESKHFSTESKSGVNVHWIC